MSAGKEETSWNGYRPVASSKMTMPKLQMSDARLYSSGSRQAPQVAHTKMMNVCQSGHSTLAMMMAILVKDATTLGCEHENYSMAG